MRSFKFDITSSDPCGILGNTFGKLTVLTYEGHWKDDAKKHTWQYWYRVRCSCRAHTEFVTSYRELVSGNTTGCVRCKVGEPILIGDRFGSLTVKDILQPKPGASDKHSRAVCECDCGNIVTVSINHLRSGNTKSCGDPKHCIRSVYTGRLKVGHLAGTEIEVLSICETERSSKGERLAVCKCHHVNPITNVECGKIFKATVSNLLTGNTKSCGCSHRFYPNVEAERLGHKWFSMQDRCNNPANKSYKDYGGRGILVSSEWDKSREGRAAFVRDGIQKGFVLGQSIDRIDNNAGYSSGNVRYVGNDVQNNNRRSNRYIEVDGHRLTIAEWAKLIHVNRVMLSNKLRFCKDESEYIRRLSLGKVRITDRIPEDLTEPRKVYQSRTIEVDGDSMSARKWAERLGIIPQQLYYRMNSIPGFDIQEFIRAKLKEKQNEKNNC